MTVRAFEQRRGHQYNLLRGVSANAIRQSQLGAFFWSNHRPVSPSPENHLAPFFSILSEITGIRIRNLRSSSASVSFSAQSLRPTHTITGRYRMPSLHFAAGDSQCMLFDMMELTTRYLWLPAVEYIPIVHLIVHIVIECHR